MAPFLHMKNAAINKVRRELSRQKLDALLVSKEANVSYLSSFAGEGNLLITPTKKILLVDFRFKEQAEKEARLFQIYHRRAFEPLEDSLAILVKKLKLKRVGFESAWLSLASYRRLKKAVGKVKLTPTANIVEHLRAIKTLEEIKLLRKAAALAVKSLEFARKLIKPGKTEQEIAREVQYFMHKSGAETCAFEVIVASGKRSSLPHGPTSRKIIKKNEAVLVDLGCRFSGYNSDLTRMVFLGRIRGKLKRVYEVVLEAQQQAIQAVRAGERASGIDKVARQYITQTGLGAFFGHALGHGLGREVHEYPLICPKNHQILQEGMVFTVEPGVYIPGFGGVRIEDMVLVTKTGCEILTDD